MPGPLRVSRNVLIPEHELHWRFSRSSGPGGQHVNTTDTRVELSWDVARSTALGPHLRERALDRLGSRLNGGVLTVSASEERSQLRNRESAEAKLIDAVAQAVAPPPRARRATRPSRGAVQRRIDQKKRRSDVKRDRRRPID